MNRCSNFNSALNQPQIGSGRVAAFLERAGDGLVAGGKEDAIESATLDIKLTKQMATIECNIRSILLGLSCVQEGVVDELIWGRQKHLHPRKMLQDMRGLPLASPCA
eukprot:scaffold317735_cov15-Tisochrysis_lutea.AAC.1